tara:strand:- start:371 stop:544 length:174 start_codon:yes stop_codon:yes gene_type:complete
MVNYIFWTGVEIFKVSASWLGITYQELNVYFFIYLQPHVDPLVPIVVAESKAATLNA